MAKKAAKVEAKTVAPEATTFKELAIAFESMSLPTSEKMLQLEQQAWALLQGVAAQVDWSEYRVSPLFVSGPFANWWAFVEEIGRAGNVKAAFPEVVKASRAMDASEWQSRIVADAAVCRWMDEIALDQTPNEILNRLVRLAGHFSERASWQRIIELRHDLKSLEGLALAWANAGLAQAQCNLEMLRNGLARLAPVFQKHVPAVDVAYMPIPSEAEIAINCDRCQQAKSGLQTLRLRSPSGQDEEEELLTEWETDSKQKWRFRFGWSETTFRKRCKDHPGAFRKGTNKRLCSIDPKYVAIWTQEKGK
ncbi:MAG: hypothetical protein U0929_15320 [Planctomycetaceae bacterium]